MIPAYHIYHSSHNSAARQMIPSLVLPMRLQFCYREKMEGGKLSVHLSSYHQVEENALGTPSTTTPLNRLLPLSTVCLPVFLWLTLHIPIFATFGLDAFQVSS